MKRNINKIFWGLIFISFNINLTINILPNIVGYALILFGLNGIIKDVVIQDNVKYYFAKGVIPSKIMIAVEVVNIIMQTGINNLNITYKNIYTGVISIANVFYLIIIFSICSGIYEITKGQFNSEIGYKIKKAWGVFLPVWVISAVIFPLTLNLDRVVDSMTIDNIVYLIGMVLFVIQVYIIILVRSLRNKININSMGK